MPLEPGSSQRVISDNIRELTHHGSRPRSHDQIVAIALANADRHPRRAFGGDILPHFDDGGMAFGASPGAFGVSSIAAAQQPQGQQLRQRASQMTAEQLQEAVSRLPPNSPQSIILKQALQQKQMMPNAQPAQTTPNTQPGYTGPGMAGAGMGTMRRGGALGHFDMGGSPTGIPTSMASPWWERSEERGLSGLLTGNHGGRTDTLRVRPLAGSYILPADIVSSLGEGDTKAGARVWAEMLRTGPWGTSIQRPTPLGIRPPREPMESDQGQETISNTGQSDSKGGALTKPTDIMAASGEIIVHPKDVMRIGRGSLKRGHAILDGLVKAERERNIETLKKLPGPVKS